MRWVALVLVTAFGFGIAACGSESSGSGGGSSGGDELDPGFTECGSSVCQPGTYCLNGACIPGCVSSANCQTGTTCEISGGQDGTCEGSATTATTGGGGECDPFAAYAEMCGLAASHAEAIRQTCGSTSEAQKQAMAACAASATCTEFKQCIGAQCLSDADCQGGLTCTEPGELQPFICQ